MAVSKGTVAVQVYDTLEWQPAYRPWVDLVARQAGPEAIDLLRTYFVHGDLDALTAARADKRQGLRQDPRGLTRVAESLSSDGVECPIEGHILAARSS